MLNGDGSENDKKPSMSNRKKKQLCTCSTLSLYISLLLLLG